ncbi:DNA sulfur modification protein DndD [Marinobacter sp. F4218]|uniref:DNA sulfur modification protein DndD n=1 Tax=Marinobacter sp. F4218 TaxID=2862868 RepID=UPI001C629B74|nr:DNA sulfur modification protein DndD [Marinobacter sp. F4218]MBW7469715.1 DNA sulfur modification protein DndD [Marinobacter sp. F4218]
MLIQNLTLTNFRVYEGTNSFDLTPVKRFGQTRPIILFGGLNGAGKTSLLSGIRLALYGRRSLGSTVAQKRYENYLLESIHHSKQTDRSPNTASVELTFTYAKLGTENQYRVKREWERKGKGVKETLTIEQDGQSIQGLSYEQAQTFLNELIPIGVSDLFFFDGEKIAELADDTGGAALEQSIKKLLGLDVVERLSGDLTVLKRNITKRSSVESIQAEIDSAKAELEEKRKDVEQVRQEITTVNSQRSEVQSQVNKLQKAINERGGHFSASRKHLESKLSHLQDQRGELTTQINALISDAAPLALAHDFCERSKSQIEKDLSSQTAHRELKLLRKYSKQLNERISGSIPKDAMKVVSRELDAILEQSSQNRPGEIIHDLTPIQASRLFSTFDDAQKQKADLAETFQALEHVESELDEIGVSLARAPDDILIANDFHNLQKLQQHIGGFDAKLEALKKSGKEIANGAVEAARKLDRLYEEAAKTSDQKRMLDYIGGTNCLLKDFVDQTSEAKISDLEAQFTECFAKLARKDDLQLQIRIDAKTFQVQLLSVSGRPIAKDEISAGEKQIFAISVLEALAKTSGRQLPMIVDTPLGRLDSQHRSKLIDGYFPTASHQMIVLSTDTEVDESFYSDLSPDISRAYKLEYDPKAGATRASEGYFWKMREAS